MNRFLIFLAISSFLSSCSSDFVKVACVGDSITEGMTIVMQSEDAYPAQLDKMLPPEFEVLNLGRSSTTMMRNGNFPYWTAKEFSDVFRFHPDVIVVKLGTNDSKLSQWDADAFRRSYQSMIDTFYTIVPKPEIILCLPVPPQQTRWEITDSVVANCVVPAIRDIAEANQLELIDLYNAVGHNPQLFSRDGIHPNVDGAKVIAEEVAKHLVD